MASGPLDGTKVLEFTQIIAGPLGCQLLSDLGADVVKVEPVMGEVWRLTAAFMPGESKWFHSLNRGKKSLAINIADPQVLEAIHRLVRETDVVVINYRPDVATRLRIDYETLSAINPSLIYVDNTAFGREGEMASRPGYDIVVQALCGLLAAIGKVNADGQPAYGPAFADTTTGYAIATAVCAALFYRAKTGKGQKVETSLLINALVINNSQFASVPAADTDERARLDELLEQARQEGATYGEILTRLESRQRISGNIYYRCFLTSDGAIAVGALSPDLRAKVRRVLGVEHNRDERGYDPRDPKQRESDAALVKRVEAQISAESSDYWDQRFEAAGVPASKVNFAQTLIDHPQVTANGYVVELDHDLSGPELLAAPPWKMSESPPMAQSASPPLGRDNDAIFASLGYGDDEVAELRSRGAIL